MIKGYKCFNSDLTNIYGMKFEIGKTYRMEGKISFGTNGNGFHFCKNIEDTFRYFDTWSRNFCICEVIGDGEYSLYNDEYYGYYDMYAIESITINKVLNREEIINIGLGLNVMRVIRFMQGYPLTEYEIDLFKEKFKGEKMVERAIAYYQENDKDVYNIKRKKLRIV